MDKRNFLLIASLILIIGCGATHSIKIGGGYGGITGEIEYTYNPEKTKEAGKPILDSEKGEAILLSKEDLDKILGTVSKSDSKNETLSQFFKKTMEKKEKK